MGRIISVSSGKGGVGKTTVAANLAYALSKYGKKVVAIDADLDMANLELAFGMEGRPITLQDVLNGEAHLEDATYEVDNNVYMVPAGISPSQFKRVDPEKFADIVRQAAENSDFVILDCPAGIGKDTTACFSASKEVIIVMTPEPMSATDAYKTLLVAEKMGNDVVGVVLNMVRGVKNELNSKEVTSLLNLTIIGTITEDSEVKQSVLSGKLLMKNNPQNASAIEIKRVAARLAGAKFVEEQPKKSFLSGLFGIFKRR
ncbi:MAG: cell division ATPase MinD [Candidatus Micrarchaeota archaeon]